MDTVIVQLPEPRPDARREPPWGPAPGGPPTRPGGSTRPALLHLGPGEVAEFGRGEPGRPVAIPLSDQGVSRRAGEITAAEDYWRLSNFSSSATYVVENLEGAGEHVKVAPGGSARRCRSSSPGYCCPPSASRQPSRSSHRSTPTWTASPVPAKASAR